MQNKLLNFHLYRFHLLPITSEDRQVQLFSKDKLSFEEIKEKKNLFFQEVLNELVSSTSSTNPLKLHDKDGNFYVFKIAQKKSTEITRDFKVEKIDNEPYVYVIINNNPSVQKIAISENAEAFSSPNVVKNILTKLFVKDLQKFQLNIALESLFDSVGFWEYVKEHKKEITYINFQYIKPNLADISKTLSEDFKSFSNSVNSHESNVSLKAPQNGVLENINKTNKEINGFVSYASEGGGSIKLKVKGIRKQLNTKESPVIIQIEEIDMEGAPEQLIKVYKGIVEE